MTVQQPTFGQTTTEAAKDDFDKFVQRAADSDGDESVYSDDLGRQESGALITTPRHFEVLPKYWQIAYSTDAASHSAPDQPLRTCLSEPS